MEYDSILSSTTAIILSFYSEYGQSTQTFIASFALATTDWILLRDWWFYLWARQDDNTTLAVHIITVLWVWWHCNNNLPWAFRNRSNRGGFDMRNCALIRYNTRYQPHYTIHVLLRRSRGTPSPSSAFGGGWRWWTPPTLSFSHSVVRVLRILGCLWEFTLIYPRNFYAAAPISLHFSAAIDIDNISGSRCAAGWFVCWLVE